MKFKETVVIIFTALIFSNCSKEAISEQSDPITGQWFLTEINDTDVSAVECYNDSFIESDGTNITFFILDRLEDGSCQQVLNESSALTIEDDFYYLEDEVIDFNIVGRSLTWRVDFETTLVFAKR